MTGRPSVVRGVELPGGRRLLIRREQPSDAESVIALYERMNEDELYCRFFTARRPPDQFIERMTHVHERGGVGLIAEMDSGRGHVSAVAEASYELLDNGDGELGIAVDDRARGWLGPYLLDSLIEEAARRGVPNIEAEVLLCNRRMLSVLRARGYVVLDHFMSPATIRVAVAAATPLPGWPGPRDRPRLLVEVAGGQWHLAAAMERRGFQVLACPGPDRGGPPCGPVAGRSCPIASGADVIVDAQPGAFGDVLASAHPRLHGSIPVCRAGPAGPDRPAAGREPGDRFLPAGDDATAEFLQSLADRPRHDLGP